MTEKGAFERIAVESFFDVTDPKEAGYGRPQEPSGTRSTKQPANRPDRLTASRAPRCKAKAERDRRPGSFGNRASSGRFRQASKGNKAHGSIGCESLATEAHTTDSSVEQSPGVDRHTNRTTQVSAWSVGDEGVDGGAECDNGHTLGCAQVERHRCSEGMSDWATNCTCWVQTNSGALRRAGRPSVLRYGRLRRVRSPGGTAPRNDRPGNRLGIAGNGAEAQGQPCGEASGAGGITSVVARANPLQSAP
jgi:hypothetical protein